VSSCDTTSVVTKPFRKDCRGESISVRHISISITQFSLDDTGRTAIHRYRYIFSAVSCDTRSCALTYFFQTRYIVVVSTHEKTYLARSYHGSFFDQPRMQDTLQTACALYPSQKFRVPTILSELSRFSRRKTCREYQGEKKWLSCLPTSHTGCHHRSCGKLALPVILMLWRRYEVPILLVSCI
jgi:hypothetical protein